MLHRFWRRLFVAFTTLAIAMSVTVTPVFASTSCSPGRNGDGQHYWVGKQEVKGSGDPALRGIQAEIENQTPWVSMNSTSSVWIMLANYGVGSRGAYVQIGYMDQNFGGLYVDRTVFIEADQDGNGMWDVQYRMGDTTDNTFTTFKIGYDTSVSPAKFRFYQSGTLVRSIDAEFTPGRAIFEGEVNSSGDQLTGTWSDPTNFESSIYKSGDTWWNLEHGPYSHVMANDNPDWFGRQDNPVGDGPQDFRIWDRC